MLCRPLRFDAGGLAAVAAASGFCYRSSAMPKSRPPRRSQPETLETPPDRAEVERAVEAVLDRLKPRRRAPKPAGTGPAKPPAALTLVPDREG